MPDGITVTTGQDLRYELAPGGYAAWDLTVRAAPGTGPGRYFAAARIRDEHGHVIEDTAMVAVGERRWPDPALPPEEALMLMQADFIAAAAEVELAVLTPELRMTPGSRDELLVSVTTRLASEVHGEVQLVSPFGLWTCSRRWRRASASRRGSPRCCVSGRGAGHGAARDPVAGRWSR